MASLYYLSLDIPLHVLVVCSCFYCGQLANFNTNMHDSPRSKRKRDDYEDDSDYDDRRRRSRSPDRRSRKSHRRRRYIFTCCVNSLRSRSYSPDEKYRHRPQYDGPPLTVIEEKPGDRERRSVIISRLPSTVTEQDIHEFFQPAGRIRDVKLMRDRFTGKSKGYGHVEFFDEGSIYPAIALNARPLRGFPVMIKTSGKVYSNMITHDRCG